MPKYAKLGIALAVVALATFGGYLLFKTEPISLTVVGFSWERRIDIEWFKTFVEEGSYVPPGGRKISQRTSCTPTIDFDGDVGIECETFYTYEIDRWVYAFSRKSSDRNKLPRWPQTGDLNEWERIGDKTQKYTVHLKNQNGIYYEYFCKEREWQTYNKDELVLARLDRFGIRKLVKLEKE